MGSILKCSHFMCVILTIAVAPELDDGLSTGVTQSHYELVILTEPQSSWPRLTRFYLPFSCVDAR